MPFGPLCSQLTSGISVRLENGATVTPEMVLDPMKPGRGVAIVDLPNKRYLSDLMKRPEWTNETIMEGVEAIIWILGPKMKLGDLALESFMRSLPNTKHIVSSKTTCPDYLALDSSAASAVRLSKIWEDVFPVPVHDNVSTPQQDLYVEHLQTSASHNNFYLRAERGLQLQIEPVSEVRKLEVEPYLDTAKVIDEMPTNVHELALRATAACTGSMQHHSDFDPEIVTLGTGAASPSKYRNVSATLLRIPQKGSYLFDCGENTLGQLSRVYTPRELDDVLLDIRLIWVSHLHADHHLGTVSVIAAQRRAWRRRQAVAEEGRSQEPFLVVASEAHMIGFLEDYGSVENVDHVRKVVASPDEGLQLGGKPYSFSADGVPIKLMRTCNVSHCAGAQAVSVTFETGFKFSYSGDCRPCSSFVEIGSQSDVLVHEATFDDGLEGDALAKKHCTTGEALAVAARMGAKNVVLTHFSQRYQKIPVLSDVKLPKNTHFDDAIVEALGMEGPVDAVVDTGPGRLENNVTKGSDTVTVDPQAEQSLCSNDVAPLDVNIAVAFDYMKIRVSQIKDFHKYTPALRALFEVETTSDKGSTVNNEKDKDADGDGDARRGLERQVNRAKNKSKGSEAQKRKEASSGEQSVEGREGRKKHMTLNDVNSHLEIMRQEVDQVDRRLQNLHENARLEAEMVERKTKIMMEDTEHNVEAAPQRSAAGSSQKAIAAS